MSNNLVKIIIGGVFIILLTASGVLIYNYINQAKEPSSSMNSEEKADLYETIISGDISNYEQYLADGEKLSFAYANGATPLELLIEAGDILNADKLVKNGFDLTLIDNNHADTITSILVYNEEFKNDTVNEIAKTLINQIQNEIDEEDSFGYSLLINGIETDNIALVTEIVKYTQDIDKDYNGQSALTFACSLGNDNLDIIQLLIEKGADVNHQDEDGNTCLMNTLTYGNQERLIRYILTVDDVDLNIQNDFGQTVLHLCVEYTRLVALDIILQNPNVNKNIEDNDGYTAKRYAEYENMEDFVNKL